MITSSHRMIGEFLLRYIRENGGVELDREGFLQGSTLPDFRAFYKSMPHEPSYWARYLQNEIGALSRLTRGLEPFGPAFSRRLGIVCHFYADFFCFPHTAGYPDGLIRHLRYEWALNSRLRGGLPSAGIRKIVIPAPAGLDEKQIFSLYAELHRAYLEKPPSFDHDIAFAIRACVGVVAAVTANAGAKALTNKKRSADPVGTLLPLPKNLRPEIG